MTEVHHDLPNGVQRHEAFVRHPIAATVHEASHLRPAERSVHEEFVEAVHAFSDDPGPANLARYLAASRSLEESQASLNPRGRRTKRKEYAR